MSKTTTVTSPSAALMKGEITSFFGDRSVTFKDGVAKIEDIGDALLGYFEQHGFGIDGSEPDDAPADPTPADPRKVGDVVQVGSNLRDAAVNPHPDDFLAPTNAGEANPHGPDVVSPEIHASEGVRPVKAGDATFDGDTAAQSDAETAHAAAATDGTPVVLTPEEIDAMTDEERDLLGLSGEKSDSEETELKGEALTAKLAELGLSADGTVEEKRARVRIAQTDASELKGADLDAALVEADLPRTGTADERRARLQEFRDGQAD